MEKSSASFLCGTFQTKVVIRYRQKKGSWAVLTFNICYRRGSQAKINVMSRPQKITIRVRAYRSPWTKVFALPMLKLFQVE